MHQLNIKILSFSRSLKINDSVLLFAYFMTLQYSVSPQNKHRLHEISFSKLLFWKMAEKPLWLFSLRKNPTENLPTRFSNTPVSWFKTFWRIYGEWALRDILWNCRDSLFEKSWEKFLQVDLKIEPTKSKENWSFWNWGLANFWSIFYDAEGNFHHFFVEIGLSVHDCIVSFICHKFIALNFLIFVWIFFVGKGRMI